MSHYPLGAGLEPPPGFHAVKRNFRLLAMDAIFYFCGLAFMDASTVLPAFLATLTSSPLVIGTLIAIRPAGIFIPQLWTAHYLSGRKQHKSFLIKVAAVSRVAITFFALILFVSGPKNAGLMLTGFILFYTAFWFSEGGAGVPWTDLVAKTIPERLRGRLFGLMQVVGGLLAMMAAWLVKWTLGPHGPAYPTNYAFLMAVSAMFYWLSLISLACVLEPEGPIENHNGGFWEYLGKLGKAFRQHSQLKLLIAIQLLVGMNGLSLPFYILYAEKVARIGGGMVGAFLFVQTAGSILSALITGQISDHRGPKSAIMIAVILAVLTPVSALMMRNAPGWTFGIVFLLLGGLVGCAWIGMTNFLLEISSPEERRGFIGLMNTANVPSLLYPVLGGLVVQFLSHEAVFALTALTGLIALLLCIILPPTRSPI